MQRYEEHLELKLSPEQARHLVENRRPGDREQLSVQIRGETLEAIWPANDTFDNPPNFAGRVERRGDGVLIAGTIREAWANMMWSWIWRIPTFIMVACVAVGVVVLITNGVHDGLAPLLIGVVGTPVFALMWRWQRGLRKPTFDGDARKLTNGLQRYLTTGDGSRPLW